MPTPPPVMTPPLKLFTLRVVDAWMAALFAPVASILPALPVTVTFLPEIAEALSLLTLTVRMEPLLPSIATLSALIAMPVRAHGLDRASIGGDMDGPGTDGGCVARDHARGCAVVSIAERGSAVEARLDGESARPLIARMMPPTLFTTAVFEPAMAMPPCSVA